MAVTGSMTLSLCNGNKMDDESHFLFEGQNATLVQYRSLSMPPYYRIRQSVFKTVCYINH